MLVHLINLVLNKVGTHEIKSSKARDIRSFFDEALQRLYSGHAMSQIEHKYI